MDVLRLKKYHSQKTENDPHKPLFSGDECLYKSDICMHDDRVLCTLVLDRLSEESTIPKFLLWKPTQILLTDIERETVNIS